MLFPRTPPRIPAGYLEAALVRLKDDVGVLAEGPVITAFSILHATDMPAYLRLRQRAKGANKDASITLLDKLVRQALPGSGDDPSTIDELVALAREHCQLAHDADRKAVAIIPMDERREVWRVYSPGFENWLSMPTESSKFPTQALRSSANTGGLPCGAASRK